MNVLAAIEDLSMIQLGDVLACQMPRVHRLRGLETRQRRALGGHLFKAAGHAAELVAHALDGHAPLFRGVPFTGADIRRRGARIVNLHSLERGLSDLLRLCTDTRIREEAERNQLLLSVVKHSDRLSQDPFCDPRETLLREGALSEAKRVLAAHYHKGRKDQTPARRDAMAGMVGTWRHKRRALLGIVAGTADAQTLVAPECNVMPNLVTADIEVPTAESAVSKAAVSESAVSESAVSESAVSESAASESAASAQEEAADPPAPGAAQPDPARITIVTGTMDPGTIHPTTDSADHPPPQRKPGKERTRVELRPAEVQIAPLNLSRKRPDPERAAAGPRAIHPLTSLARRTPWSGAGDIQIGMLSFQRRDLIIADRRVAQIDEHQAGQAAKRGDLGHVGIAQVDPLQRVQVRKRPPPPVPPPPGREVRSFCRPVASCAVEITAEARSEGWRWTEAGLLPGSHGRDSVVLQIPRWKREAAAAGGAVLPTPLEGPLAARGNSYPHRASAERACRRISDGRLHSPRPGNVRRVCEPDWTNGAPSL